MIPQEIQNGRGLTPDNYNSLVRTVMANRIAPGNGYTVLQSPRGVSLAMAQRGGGGSGTTAVCPFQVTTANVGDDWKFSIAWGMVGVPAVLPIGMFPNNVPPLTMTWGDGWVYMQVQFVTDDTAVKEVQFKNAAEIPPADETYAYYPIAYINTDSSGGEPTQRIQNLCSAPIPSVCDLALPTQP